MQNNFPNVSPKQSFPALESEVLAYWKRENTFKKSIESRPEDNPYRFYDGPPFITGTPHYGSLLSSIVKDAVGRYWTMRGKRVDRIWGWDCHGLPIEEKVQKKLGLSSNKEIEERGIKEFIDGCYEYTETTSAEWDWYIDKIGRWVDMDRAYRTMDQDYMESVMWVFKQLWDKGLIYKGKRVSLYSWKLSTPISNFEVAMDDTYQDVNDPAITVKFILEDENIFGQKTAILAWTTTPWTIPANMALSVGKDIDYVLVKNGDEQFIVAKSRAEAVFKGKGEYEIIREFKGEELVGMSYKPPFDYFYNNQNNSKNHKVYHADFATDTDGTGIVHTAPEFGDVDYQLGKELGLTITEALDDEGKYTSQISDYVGTHYLDANKINVERMKENGTLFKNESITHLIPFCPRSGTPLVQKAQDSWFIDIQSQKEKLLAANEKINWFPEYLKYGRFAKGIESAPDWCISRTRFWGCPMPVWLSTDGKEQIVVASRDEIFAKNLPYNQLETREIDGKKKYFFKGGEFAGTELNLHRPYIDDILLVNEKNFEAKNIIGIHGWKSHGNGIIWETLKNNFGENIFVPKIDDSENTNYATWKAKFDEIDFTKFDTIVAHSLGCPMIVNYILEKKIAVKRLVLVAPSAMVKNPAIAHIADELVADKKFLKNFAEEIVVIHSKDDDSLGAPFNDGQSIAKEIGANFVAVNGYKHNFANGGAEIVSGIVKHGAPLTRIKEVLDVWMDSGSMPYAQMHYPFENKNAMEASFPADFIAEYVGQVRAWFYVMHVLGVLLGENIKNTSEPTPSFTNVITTGVINGNDGRKMSKSYGNYPDPRATIEKYGADPIRFYMLNSPVVAGGDMDFKEEGVVETVKSAMLPIWNTYSFFTTYANIDGWKPSDNLEPNPINPLDSWILSKLQILIGKVHDAMDGYDISRATRAIVDYMGELTNWYVRLSRRRFWGSEMTADKNSAYETLYVVLVEVSKLLAPYMPFLAEDMFRGLTGRESVHLEYVTLPNPHLISDDLNRDMELAANFVSLGLSLRAKKNIRVRQPLASLTITHDLSDYYKEIIKNELNVKEIIFENPENLAKKICKPDARKIGPKFGKDVQKIIVAAKNGDFTENSDGSILVGEFRLEAGEFVVEYQPLENVGDVEGGYGLVISMDTNLTENLIAEGIARDIIRQIQDMRKEADYQVTDKIFVKISAENIAKITDFVEMIENETLSTHAENLENADIEKEFDMEDFGKVKIAIKK